VVSDLDGEAQVLRNETADTGSWLRVKLEGGGRLTDGLGATITVRLGDRIQTRLVQSGSSYLSQDDMRQHFGLGDATTVDAVEVRWPDGSVTTERDVAANQTLVIRQR
jgi:hypothetical protein